MSRLQNPKAGFTLVEMLVVLALMIVMTVMLEGFGSASHQKTQKELCSENLQKIYLTLQIYANDFGGNFPVNTNARTSEDVLDVLLPKYTVDNSIFICPGGRDSKIPLNTPLRNHRISYAYYMGQHPDGSTNLLMSDRQINTLPKKASDQVFSLNGKSPGNNHHKYGGNVLFVDGSVEATKARAEFPMVFSNSVILLNPRP